ncbi:MAG: hypothetical protein KAI47_22555, partial [Deltaproteobacteria bacterium]|nr:hypothetical protein [Deltaproteobacteria bacterium]
SKGTRRDSSWLLIPIGAGVVALAIAAFLWASGIVGGNEGPKPIPRPGTQSPPASHPTGVAAVPLKQTPQGETVLLKIRSTPQGASVFEKGKKGSLGETPFELRLPSPEDPKTPIVLVFKLEGYPTQEREIGIHAQTLTVAFTDSQVASDVAKVGPKGRKTSSARSKHRRRPPKHRSVKHETPTVIDPDAKKPATKKPKKINETDQVDPFAS